MSELLKITPADRMPHRHGDGCFCDGGRLAVEHFARRGVELTPLQLEAGLGAREAAALLSGAGLSSVFVYRGQAQACMWLLGFMAAGRTSYAEGPGEGPWE